MSSRPENTFGRDIIPQNEQERIENLKKYHILDTRSEPVFDQLAATTATLLDVPIALINFVDDERVWTKANHFGEAGAEVDRNISLCSLAILTDKVTVFKDALKEACLISNPLVAGDFGLRAYAAAPITSEEGYNVGAVCVVDKEVREFSESDTKKLQWIAAMVSDELKKRKSK